MFYFLKTKITSANDPYSNSGTRRTFTSMAAGSLAMTLVIFALMLAAPTASRAQVLYGSLTGNVNDANGAIVSGAKIEITNLGTGEVKTTIADDRGGYSFSSVSPGEYKIIVSNAGFKTTIKEKVTILANGLVRFDAKLEVGDVAATVNVSDDAIATLQTDRTDVSTQLQGQQLENLPVTSSAGRNFQALYKIVPGFSLVTEGVSSDGGNPQRTMTGNVNGNSFQANSTAIDGASNNYIWLPFNTAYVPPQDSIQSVNIVTNSYDAEIGNANGASVSVITKSGTNGFHGSVFEYHTDSSLKARNRFQLPTASIPKIVLNQYGFVIGGPIWKNKLFFFTDYEATKRRQTANRTVTVINPAGIFDAAGNANLSAILPAGANCTTTPVAGCIYDPNTGTAAGTGRTWFAGNIIPANRISPAVRLMLSRIRSEGFLNGTGVTATNNYNTTGPASLNRSTNDFKFNYLPNNKSTVFFRYSISQATYFDPPVLGDAMGGASGGGQVGIAPSRIQNVGAGGTYNLASNKVIDINAGYTRQRLGAVHQPDIDLGDFGVDTLHIPGTNGPSTFAKGTPGFIFTQGGWNGIGNTDTGNPFNFLDDQYVANANMSWILPSHEIRFGAGMSVNQLNHFQPQGGAFQSPRGAFRFTGNITALSGGPAANKANSLADFLLGLPGEVGKAVQLADPNSLRWNTWSAYIRDQWHINKDITLNLGMRWEHYPMANAGHGKGVKLFDPNTGNVLVGGYGSVPVDDGVDAGTGQFLPRIGMAYRWGSKTVLRTGFGVSADSNNWRFFRNNYPATVNSSTTGATTFQPAAFLTTGFALTPYPGLGVGIPTVAAPDLSTGVLIVPNGVNPGNTIPFDFKRGRVYSFNLTLQREFYGFVGEVAYVGNRGRNLLTNRNINPAPINTGNNGRPLFVRFGKNFGDVNCFCPDGKSQYDAMQTKLTRRLGAASYIGFSWTWSKAMNEQDNEEVAGTFGGQGGFLLWPLADMRDRNWALATFDRTHNFVAYGLYELPFGKKQRWVNKGILSHIVGGWQINWLVQAMSGSMMSLIGGGAQVNAPGSSNSADQIGPLNILGNIGPLPGGTCAATDMSCHYFDPSAFRAVPGTEIRFGTTGRNIIRGPGFYNLDVSLFRTFSITERVKFQIRAEMFGATNTPHYANPGTDPTNATTFGVITGTVNTAGRGSGTGGERQLWLAGRVTF